jgi:hypothetical protein
MASVSWDWRHAGPQCLLRITTRHSPAEIARKMSIKGGGGMFPRVTRSRCRTPDSRLQSLSAEQDHQFRGAIFFERRCCLLVQCQHMQEKTGGGRVLFPLKRANISAFGLCDRAAGCTGGFRSGPWVAWGTPDCGLRGNPALRPPLRTGHRRHIRIISYGPCAPLDIARGISAAWSMDRTGDAMRNL